MSHEACAWANVHEPCAWAMWMGHTHVHEPCHGPCVHEPCVPDVRACAVQGDCRPVVQVGDGPADVAEVDDAAGGSSSVRGRLAMRRNPSPKPQQLFNR